MAVYHFDPQSLLFASHGVHCLELAALDTLQHGLAGDPEHAHCFSHGQEVVARLVLEPSDEGIGQTNTPWRTMRQLLAANDPAIEQAVQGRWGNAKRSRRLPDVQQLAVGFFSSALEARDIPMVAQAADVARLESMATGRGTPLPIKDARNDAVGVIAGQAANERDRVLVGADGRRPRTWQRQVYFIECATLPADHKMHGGLVALDFDGDLFNERPK
ncbi:MAG: hypothetical protein ACREFP_01755 [Acetobacteraceae bacterium]